ncbi:MAG: prolipoprotein diacylglyceryl transferase [Ignavibacteriales bacterium]|nr:prolipoprotein diacylglyceryl transferase [Ignavibacteriales bacterium]
MYPRLFEIGGIPVYGYGLMLAVGFIVASSLLSAELKRKQLNVDVTDSFVYFTKGLFVALVVSFLATFGFQRGLDTLLQFAFGSTLHTIVTLAVVAAGFFLFRKQAKGSFDLANAVTLLALTFGVVGSKTLYVLEHLTEFSQRPFDTAFSPGGLTFYGGFLLATLAIYLTTRKAGVPFLAVADAASPGLIIGYGIARIGCHLAGDGDYGFPTTLPWGTDYSRGTFPPSEAFKPFPEITSQFPNGIVPDTTPCHPTPVYELILCALIFWFLWSRRSKATADGKLFMMYLLFAGLERFVIEFFRINPRIALGLSEAQLIAVLLVAVGALGWYRLSKARDSETA